MIFVLHYQKIGLIFNFKKCLLIFLGYTQDAVIRALGITRNDVAMACDILHEFGTKQTT